MASIDVVGHPLSLKVMRVSRPSLASHWQPFFSSSPSFSAHSTANVLSLQESEPLEGHPKTLRDLTQAGQMLTLPAAFGAIQLGETFSCCLCVNNESVMDVDSVSVKVEMQTATNKVALAEIGGPKQTLTAKDTLETMVRHEIKELGQHVLACSVTYRTPPGMRPVTSGSEHADDPFLQTFRKFYKFVVTNPLSVKTKVHVPRSPSAMLSRSERDKVFLEVQVQNLTQGPLWFEKIRLEPVDGWDVIDANTRDVSTGKADIKDAMHLFSGNMAIMQPQDSRQYIYIMTPRASSSTPVVPIPPAPGTIIPLGRLDISWRSSMGEPGRLLTSILSRRIPLPQPAPASVAPASALPPYLQKSHLPGPPSRSRSPSLLQQQQRTSTPPLPSRPESPLKRVAITGVPGRPQSPVPAPLATTPSTRADIEVDIVVLETPVKSTVNVEERFTLRFALGVSATLSHRSRSPYDRRKESRILKLAIQHTTPAPPRPPPPSISAPAPVRTPKRANTTPSFSHTDILSPRSSSIDALTPRQLTSPPPGAWTPNGQHYAVGSVSSIDKMASPTSAVPRQAIGIGGLAERLRSVAVGQETQDGSRDAVDVTDSNEDELNGHKDIKLPHPYSSSVLESPKGSIVGRVSFSGSSMLFLPPITFSPSSSKAATIHDTVSHDIHERGEELVEFSLDYFPLARGFTRVGGLRVLVVEDEEKVIPDSTDDGESNETTLHPFSESPLREARILREWDVVAEVWVR